MDPDTSVISDALQIAWTVARWPLLVIVVVLTFTCLYRYSPDVRHSFRECLPGAILAVGLWALLILCFRYYLALGFGAATGVFSIDPEIVLIGRAVGAVVATGFLFYFASSAVLLGAELNAELIRRARGREVMPGAPRVPATRSWPRALPPAATSLSARFLARRPSNARAANSPAPSPGRRVRVVATPATGAGEADQESEQPVGGAEEEAMAERMAL